MPKTTPEENKAMVLEAFDTLFNKRDYATAERFWSPKYIQHSAHIPPGREGLFNLVRSSPETLRYENQLIVAEGDPYKVSCESRAELSPHEAASPHPHALFQIRQSESNRS
jgi:predicted SnoaL-like aldol condensation-catalyzing enzyme